MAITSRKAIRNGQAVGIGEAIATKAWGHIITPLEAVRRELAEKLYRTYVDSTGLTPETIAKLVEANVLQDYKSCELRIGGRWARAEKQVLIGFVHHSHRYLSDLSKEEIAALPSYIASPFVIPECEATAAFEAETKPYTDALEQMQKLKMEIYHQCNGKTVASVCKAWPEAADIVCRHTNTHESADISTSKPLTTPLAQLLAQFLPALPAPATTVASVSNESEVVS